MKDNQGRTIDYVRISLTDRCNLRCCYCMPKASTQLFSHDEMLTLEELARVCRAMAAQGITRVKLTGGEPLVRRNVEWLVEQLAAISQMKDITMTTNGILLSARAKHLKQAGLTSVNVSLDTLDREQFAMITRRDVYDEVISGIESAKQAGLKVKINCAVTEYFNISEVAEFAKYSTENQIPVRFIEMMPIGQGKHFQTLDNDILLQKLKELYPDVRQSEDRLGNGPAVYYTFAGGNGCIGFISAVHHKFCGTCNRVRLTSDGYLKLCLATEHGISLRDAIRQGMDDDGLIHLIQQTIREKPEGHHFEQIEKGDSNHQVTMNQIGG